MTLSIPGLAGDYNSDAKVDAADYVLWRKNPADSGGDRPGITRGEPISATRRAAVAAADLAVRERCLNRACLF